MSRAGVREKRQARTDNTIEAYENYSARILIKATIERDASFKLYNSAMSLCKDEFERNKNSKMNIVNTTEEFRKCAESASKDYYESTKLINDNFLIERKLAGEELDQKLNDPLYSQDFNPYWK